MSKKLRVGIAGAGWPGQAHLRGFAAAGGFEVVAVADLIPERRKRLLTEAGSGAREIATADELVADPSVDVLSVCLPTHLHAGVALAGLKAGKHVVLETPPTLNPKEARQIERAAERSGKVVIVGLQRRFGGAEQASRQAIAKGYAGTIQHIRAAWTRTRATPLGTGWYTDRALAGGGALTDLGIHMLDLAWFLLDQPKPTSVYAVSHQRFHALVPEHVRHDVEDAAFALVKFENGATLELAATWAINQPPSQNGTLCRVHGDAGAIDVYTPSGAQLWRGFDSDKPAKSTALPPPKLVGHAAMMRHLRACIEGRAQPVPGVRQACVLMAVLEALQRSAATGRSVDVRE